MQQLNSRMSELTPEQKHWVLTMYANPVRAMQALD
jgi:hypothetical protein